MKHLLSAAALALITGSAHAENVGITIARSDSAFLTILRNGMQDQAAKLDGVTVQVEDAQNDASRQLDQVQNFVSSGVDAIIVVAVDGDSTPALTKMATDAGIPIVYANHPPADVDELPETAAFVGSNEIDSGTLETKEVCRLLGGKGAAYVLMGPLNNHSSLTRTKDIHDVIATDECKGMSVIEEQSANWDRLEAANIMTNWLSTGREFDAVIANNDEMAIGAIQAMKAAGVDMSKVVVGGIDATPDGLAAMAAGDLDVTVFQNAIAQGAAAMDAAVALSRDQKTERQIWVPFELVTPENMKDYATANR
ncbi:substrate-binding domain-containing protein (plasmid) [Sinorhizobium meliloti WSM1022]|jgi:ribose transport system substrate-binding protein|uniref:substrate-binding domain-containing protein n=1 Tax=Rhizobium meliloti TaxID=382 RepID=UPI0002D2D507|nr:substrate-binding domain-containing protein [Sinorhizobium meliloti]MDE3759877.1 substrate-binding domain-containing protein [Sinorhizobium meliloti]MDW9357031.1 substrate-binding domain-containing protein [Sinorhizobium meliloti]MDW9372600.1 substrate-binding domain-containing protein [Sinorhizobium meliloti]MDW9415242.1 substrate-binding domain-containing protein [Sinorhizobium meliloti]MDW9494430.1 substrate-binding domain-containing protein [Sinorhizobium meliloti]